MQKSDEFSIAFQVCGKKRKPGRYTDNNNKNKDKHNNLIALSCKTLINEKLICCVLDGQKMRTTKALLNTNNVSEINIVEFDEITYSSILARLKGTNSKDNIYVHNYHIFDYIQLHINPMVNVIYLDLMCNFFNSDLSYGGEKYVEALFNNIYNDNIIFAATFALRNPFGMRFEEEVEDIYIILQNIYRINNYQYINLNSNNSRYKGMNSGCDSMIFVIFYLYRDKFEIEI